MKQSQTLVEPEERKRIDTVLEQVKKEWRTRRKMVVIYISAHCKRII